MKQNITGAVCAGSILMGMASTADAALTSRLDGAAVYHDELNITWIADAKLASRETFGVSGINQFGEMTWDVANEWIAAMNAANYLGFDDWRLPTANPDCSNSVFCSDPAAFTSPYGSNPSEEMAYLFYNELGGAWQQPVNNSTDPDLALFDNGDGFTFGSWYYTSTEYNIREVHAFDFYSGFENNRHIKNSFANVLAVRDGDVVSPVPVPAAVWLFASGLIGLVGFSRRRR